MQSESNSSYSGKSELVFSENALPRVNSFIVEKIVKNLDMASLDVSMKVLEFGAGIGSIAKLFHARTGIKPTCIELDRELHPYISKLGFNAVGTLQQITDKYDLIYSVNVLEHIENDMEALKEIHSKLKENGVLIVFVPAHQFLFSGIDRATGHFRRYRKSELKNKILFSGFKIKKCEYSDFIGFFASLFVKIFGYDEGIGLNNQKSFEIYDKLVFPISKFLELLRFNKILGKSLFVVSSNSQDS